MGSGLKALSHACSWFFTSKASRAYYTEVFKQTYVWNWGGAIWRWVWDDPHFTKCTKCDCVLYVMANSRAGILRKAFWYRSCSLYLYFLMALWGCIWNYTCNCIVVVQCMVTDHRLRASPALWCSSLWWTTSWSQNQCCRCTQILTPSIMQDQTGAWTIDTRRPCNDIFVL